MISVLFEYKSGCLYFVHDKNGFLLVINSNLYHTLHCFRETLETLPLIGPKSLYLATPLVFNAPDGPFLCKTLSGCQRMAKIPNGVETLPKISAG